MSNSTYTTETLTTAFTNNLEEFLQIKTADGGFIISFDDLDEAIQAISRAKVQSWAAYIKNGGNARNKRSHSAQYASVIKAVTKAVQS